MKIQFETDNLQKYSSKEALVLSIIWAFEYTNINTITSISCLCYSTIGKIIRKLLDDWVIVRLYEDEKLSCDYVCLK